MKKGVMERNFKKLKSQIPQIEEISKHTKINSLWEHEAAIRKKLRELDEFKDLAIKDYKNVYEKYLEILEYISIRLLEGYNNKNNTNYSFQEVVKGNFNNYLKSGIISVLVSTHIPEMISKEFQRVFPANPKDEYRDARLTPRKIFLHLGETNTGKTYNAMMKLKGACNLSSVYFLKPFPIPKFFLNCIVIYLFYIFSFLKSTFINFIKFKLFIFHRHNSGLFYLSTFLKLFHYIAFCCSSKTN